MHLLSKPWKFGSFDSKSSSCANSQFIFASAWKFHKFIMYGSRIVVRFRFPVENQWYHYFAVTLELKEISTIQLLYSLQSHTLTIHSKQQRKESWFENPLKIRVLQFGQLYKYSYSLILSSESRYHRFVIVLKPYFDITSRKKVVHNNAKLLTKSLWFLFNLLAVIAQCIRCLKLVVTPSHFNRSYATNLISLNNSFTMRRKCLTF